jgi:hypothetical protein
MLCAQVAPFNNQGNFLETVMAGNPEYDLMIARLEGNEAFQHDGKIHCCDCFEKGRGLRALSPTREQDLYNCPYCAEVKMFLKNA